MLKTKRIGYLVLSLLICGFVISACVRSYTYPTPWWLDNDFAHYYLTSHALAHGIDPYAILQPQSIAEELGLQPSTTIEQLTNPPALAVLFIPFSLLPLKVSFLLWTALQLICFLGSWIFLERSCNWSIDAGYRRLFFLLAAFSAPIYMHVRLGQTQLLILGLVLFGVARLIRGEDFWGSLIIGVSISLKLFTWPIALLPIIIARRRAVPPLIIGFCILNIPHLFLAGIGSFYSFWARAVPFILSSAFAYTANESLPSALAATLEAVKIDSAGYVAIVQKILPLACVIFLVLIFRAAKKYPARDVKVLFLASALLLCSVICAPTVWPHYCVLLLPAFIFLSSRSEKLYSSAPSGLLLGLLSMVLASSIGIIPRSDPVTAVITAWGAAAAMLVLSVCLLKLSPARHPTDS